MSTKSNYQRFLDLHDQKLPFILGNVWDVASATTLEKSGFAALGTSSAAIAANWGYDDGENIPFPVYLSIIERIVSKVNIPVSVDLESGYGNTVAEILDNIRQLHQLGVVGINIEDSKVMSNARKLQDHLEFSSKLERLIGLLKDQQIQMFINVHCDAFLLNKPEQAIQRIRSYEEAGANGLFLPCMVKTDHIKSAVNVYQAIVKKDTQYEGIFFTAVKTTGITLQFKRIISIPFRLVYRAMVCSPYFWQNISSQPVTGHRILITYRMKRKGLSN